ncbi:unnamed protein product [Allacma fusca]|uniref:Uncharacterized protein n=1 Tax=Allacma fusca TaxID=39272 RepID=A0A8J2L3C0_9HEXA|nr:unnamed protein product [Allacma fusca]
MNQQIEEQTEQQLEQHQENLSEEHILNPVGEPLNQDEKSAIQDRKDFDKFLLATGVKVEGSNANMDHLYEDLGFQRMYQDFRKKATAIRDAQLSTYEWLDDYCVAVSPGGTALEDSASNLDLLK